MKNELYKDMYKRYQEGLSLSQVAGEYNMTRQSVYIGFKRRGFPLRNKKYKKCVIYDNKKFTLRNNGYLGCTTGKRELLHRYVYENEIGCIPDGWDIHHIDHDKTNNHIDNLVAMPKSIHAWLFAKERADIVEEVEGTKRVGFAEHYVNQFVANKYYV